MCTTTSSAAPVSATRRPRWSCTRTSSTCGWPNSWRTDRNVHAADPPPPARCGGGGVSTAVDRALTARYAELCRARRNVTLLVLVIFGLLVLVSVTATDFYPSRLWAGLP